jgi:hypothetical protein
MSPRGDIIKESQQVKLRVKLRVCRLRVVARLRVGSARADPRAERGEDE